MNTLNGFLSLENFIQYLKVEQELVLAPALQERVNESFNFLKDYAKNKVIYGVNTGFGPMAQYRIKDEDKNIQSIPARKLIGE